VVKVDTKRFHTRVESSARATVKLLDNSVPGAISAAVPERIGRLFRYERESGWINAPDGALPSMTNERVGPGFSVTLRFCPRVLS